MGGGRKQEYEVIEDARNKFGGFHLGPLLARIRIGFKWGRESFFQAPVSPEHPAVLARYLMDS